MSADLSFDLRQFQRGIDDAMKDTKKVLPVVLNKAALTAIIGGKGVKGAVQRTPRADKGNIDGVPVAEIAGFVANRFRRKGVKPEPKQFRQAVRAEYARRKRAAGYTAGPGWHKAAVAFGGRGIKTQSGFPRSEAAQGYGDKATEGNLTAILANTAPAAESIGHKALQDALNDVGRDMQQHAAEKELAAALKKHSA